MNLREIEKLILEELDVNEDSCVVWKTLVNQLSKLEIEEVNNNEESISFGIDIDNIDNIEHIHAPNYYPNAISLLVRRKKEQRLTILERNFIYDMLKAGIPMFKIESKY